MKSRYILLVVTLLLVGLTQVNAQNKKHFNAKKNIAIGGYDLVSYFDDKPQEGNSKYSTIYEGVTYQFLSADNKIKFEKNPLKYLPEYGGWCAYAMGINGDKVKVDPETYKIVSGKLYLFYNFYLTNTLNSWNEDELDLKRRADVNWDKIIN